MNLVGFVILSGVGTCPAIPATAGAPLLGAPNYCEFNLYDSI